MVKSVRVKGVEIEDEGVKEMKNRLGGLRKLEVETSWGQEAVEGGLVGADKGEWVVDVLAAVEGDGVVENKEGKERERRGSAVAASPGGSFETDWDDGSTDLGIGIGL